MDAGDEQRARTHLDEYLRLARQIGSSLDELTALVLLGRPYACLAPQSNKGIPDILGALGIPVFFQDMVRAGPADRASRLYRREAICFDLRGAPMLER